MKFTFSALLLLCTTFLYAQRNYSKEWKRIDSLIEKAGLVKSALKDVDRIYASAKKEKNDVQVIKALLYRMQLNDELSDEGRYENIALIEKEIAGAKEPSRSILHSIAGSGYWTYLQMNRWQFYQRTTTRNYDNKDIATWTLEQLNAKITKHFEKSLQNKQMLQQTKLAKYDPIIIKGNARYLRPTMYDMLAFRALDYFRNDERYINKPAYAFQINDSNAFADVPTFIKHRFKTRDSLSLHYRALQTYQDLLAFHLEDSNPAALIDADVNRLEFVRNFGTHPKKDELYKQALEKLAERYAQSNNPYAALAYAKLADWYVQHASSYSWNYDTAYRNANIQAIAIIKKALALKPIPEIAINLQNQQKQILRQEMAMKAEYVNTTGEPFRLLVTYRNIKKGYARVVKIDRNTLYSLGENPYEADYWKQALQLPAIKTFEINLPATDDYQQHSAEVKIDPLKSGAYAILLCSEKDFSAKSALALQSFNVSDISLVKNGAASYVLNRKSGAPLAKATVQLWSEYYNPGTGKTALKKREKLTADDNGYLDIPQPAQNDYSQRRLEITYGDDNLFINNEGYSISYSSADTTSKKVDEVFMFTDRDLYRPSQTVFFKGILVSKDFASRKSAVINNRKVTITLRDVNGQPVDSASFSSNEFGSFSGKFNLPSGVLNGTFTLSNSINESQQSFRVEEYKRPKFIVEMMPPKGVYRLNDSITITGSVTSYAGNKVNGAMVSFRVMRRVNTPMWEGGFMPRIWPPYPQQQVEITNGIANTDANGKFVVTFKALPDENVGRAAHPVFTYVITADVTDLNGETRSSETNVQVAYEAIKVSIDMPRSLLLDSANQVNVSTTNMNDSFERSPVNVAIYKLNAPGRIFRARYWEEPDQHVMSRDEYYKYFPYDQYDHENDETKWSLGERLVSFETSSVPDGAVKIEKRIAEPGWYMIRATAKDKFGDTVTAKKYVMMYSNDRFASPQAGSVLFADKTSPQPGEQVRYKLLSNLDSVYLVHEVLRQKNTDRALMKNISSLSKTLTIGESEYGYVYVNTVFVKNNRVYNEQLQFFIPHNNRLLDIEYVTYRDKTQPGSSEKWKVKIKGSKGEKVAAELLTSMYDKSLDQYYAAGWSFDPFVYDQVNGGSWNGDFNFRGQESVIRYHAPDFIEAKDIEYDELDVHQSYVRRMMSRSVTRRLSGRVPGVSIRGKETLANGAVAPQAAETNKVQYDASATKNEERDTIATPPPPPPARKNLNETAFFFPDLHTDSSGNVEFSFTAPEALTTWKWRILAHTKDLSYGMSEKSIITQKQLMVQPNAPRFVREGDSIVFSTKVANITSKPLSGTASIQLFNPATGKEITNLISKINQNKNFTVEAQQSAVVNFTINIPSSFTAPVLWRVIARTTGTGPALSDGEENILPVLSNRMLVTESIPLNINGEKTKSFSFDKLLKSGNNTSIRNHGLTVEFTANPAWYAIQALPYLAEEKNESAEQVYSRFYANALAAQIANSAPKLRQIIDQWKNADTAAFLSNLQKNEELKSVLLQETPWVFEAKSEAQQKRNIALLFDLAKLSDGLNSSLTNLQSLQNPTGAFTWMPGGPDDRYMTQLIATGIGRLKKLNAVSPSQIQKVDEITRKAVGYLDRQLKKDYDHIPKANRKIAGTVIAYEPIQYLYMRSFYNDIAMPAEVKTAFNFYTDLARKGWVKQTTYMRALLAIALQRNGDKSTPKNILAALKESSINNEELGMYWKDMSGGYYWYQAPVESEAVLIEAFDEITHDADAVRGMKTWLLKNKQTNNWKSSRATADACYALLLHGDNWIDSENSVSISLGDTSFSSDKSSEAGTGYFKRVISGDSVTPSMGKISVRVDGSDTNKPAWGAVYWQYFEDLDRITNATTSLKINKKLFVQSNSDRGPVIEPLDNNNTLHVGDRVKVRIELRTDRNLEYVHLKDMRAATFDPANVLSGYKWKAGLGYYESNTDAATNFFFSYLPKGVHIFEYDLFVTHTGKFSNGVATIQCMYAPEFSSHSEGIIVNVK